MNQEKPKGWNTIIKTFVILTPNKKTWKKKLDTYVVHDYVLK
jgi:hypothetical protein